VKRYFTSDTHFFDDRILKYCDRPFRSVGEMHESFRKIFRETDADEIYLLGDICAGLSAEEAETARSRLREAADILGLETKPFHLLRGNHDLLPDSFYLEAGFRSVAARLEMEVAGRPALVCHDPAAAQPAGTFCVCGHVHHLFREYRNTERNILAVNVGLDARGYGLVPETEIVTA
jgi:calcineurin-like phosphoesterase family protein